ncbi:MAG TPA: DoxX family protein [Chloroflexota bacterium]|nr:DoxX family protein [Chloroflexota bacterium]
MKNIGLLVMRLVLGSLLAAHGAQKLFGWFSGPGLQGTAGMMEKLGVRPGRIWGPAAGLGEFMGGTLTALGFLWPIGPLNIMAAMAVAIRKAHWKLPIFAGQGGAELPLTNFAAAGLLAVIGPGRYSLDHVLGMRMPIPLRIGAGIFTAVTTYAALRHPEVAEAVVNKATSAIPLQPTPEPSVMMETRPPAAERQGAQ